MKRSFSTLLAGIGVFGALAFAAADADAQHRHRHHGARVGVYFGAPLLFAPWPYYRPYYDPYYYPYRPVVIREQPVIYTEQAQPAAPPAPAAAPETQQQYWYFCEDSQTYYPHVQNCATPWQRVIPHAPR